MYISLCVSFAIDPNEVRIGSTDSAFTPDASNPVNETKLKMRTFPYELIAIKRLQRKRNIN